MTKLLLRIGAIAATASLIVFEAPATRSGEEPTRSEIPGLTRSEPTADHLRASYAAADAIFGAQRSAQEDPTLVELRESLAELRSHAKRLVVRRGTFLRRTRSSGALNPNEPLVMHSLVRDPASPPAPEEVAAERELRIVLARLERRIASAQARSQEPNFNSEVLRQATQKARELHALADGALHASRSERSYELRDFESRLVLRRRDGREAVSPREGGESPALEAPPPTERRAPTMSTTTRHRDFPQSPE